MAKFIIKRVAWIIPVLLGVLFLVFTINYFTPGDPVQSMLGSYYTQEQYDAKAAELGLDRPFFKQFVDYLVGIVTKGDLGTSYAENRPVKTLISERFSNTLLLGLYGTILSVIIAIPLGITSALRQYSVLDYFVTIGSVLFASIPNFWLALMSIIVFSFHLNWLPASGLDSPIHWLLPVICLGLGPVASVVRMTRSSMLEVVRQDYIVTARAKGLPERNITFGHAMKNALIPVVTVVGMQMTMIMGGSILVESIFSIPGLGTLMSTAISRNDYPVIQGCILIISVSVCVMNLLVDIAYAYIDPRIMAQYAAGKKKERTAKTKKAAAEEV